jgi:hypothetical protein
MKNQLPKVFVKEKEVVSIDAGSNQNETDRHQPGG